MTEIGTSGAVSKARAVYPDSNVKTTGDAVSTLPYGVQWDSTIRWLENNYSGISQGSSGKGNCGSEVIEKTGSDTEYALNNIYDMLGNVEEWTMESSSTNLRICRGGHIGYNLSSFPISFRDDLSFSNGADYIGFRIALYIK